MSYHYNHITVLAWFLCNLIHTLDNGYIYHANCNQIFTTNRPDITVMVGWALKINYLFIYFTTENDWENDHWGFILMCYYISVNIDYCASNL